MGITVFKDNSESSRTYLRITRAINGREQQRYVRVEGTSKLAMKQAMKEARDIDQRLEQWQVAVKDLISLRGDNLIHEDGTIVGLQLQTRHREGRKPATEFKIRVKLNGGAPLFKSVSVDRYGFDEAFKVAINRICELRNLSRESEAFGRLLEAKEAYQQKYNVPKTKPSRKVKDKTSTGAKSKSTSADRFLGQFKELFKKKAG